MKNFTIICMLLLGSTSFAFNSYNKKEVTKAIQIRIDSAQYIIDFGLTQDLQTKIAQKIGLYSKPGEETLVSLKEFASELPGALKFEQVYAEFAH